MSLDEARDRICQLEDAVKRLDTVRKHLMRNASEICGEIRGSISRSIDCLRNRELALLGEVDQVRAVKEETLRIQQGRLTQAMNILRTAITLVQEDSASEKHLADTLERLNQLELSPEETPYIAFRADQLQMRENLLNYGRVDANGLPLAIAFDDTGKPSASLPRHLEEYEDADHHIFNKTLQDFRKETDTGFIRVCIPKLSQRPEDWLQQKPSVPGTNERARMAVSRPSTLTGHSLVSSISSPDRIETNESPRAPPSQGPSPGGSCSLNNWLSLIKHHADLEEEHDFEIFDNSRCENMEVDLSSSSPSDQPDLQRWLSPSSSSTSSSTCPASTSSLFDHITKDPRAWLLQVQQQLSNVEEMKQEDLFQHISKEPSSWLRLRAGTRQGYLSNTKGYGDYFSHITKDSGKWLKKQGKMNENICIEKSAKRPLSPAHTQWLMHSNGRIHNQSSGMTQSQIYPTSPARIQSLVSPSKVVKPSVNWLQSPSTMSAGNSPLSIRRAPISNHALSGDNGWLRNSLVELSMEKLNLANGEEKNGTDAWLMKKAAPPLTQQSREGSVCSLTSGSDFSDWLFVPAGRGHYSKGPSDSLKGSEEVDKESTASCSWSICSSSQSITSEQHAKDLAVATEYYNKWLL